MAEFDTVITNGLVFDGTGASPTNADVGIRSGLIVDVGNLSARRRRATVDARGSAVTPGFIDTHTHVEIASLRSHPDRFAPIAQGVTTTLTGSDGFGWVALPSATRHRWWEDTASIYGPPLHPLPSWNSPSDFLADLTAASPTNVIAMVPHGNVRASVMGSSRRRASPSEMSAMGELTREWMDAGAAGMASGLDYIPGRFADTDELVELLEIVSSGRGVYATHLRLNDLGRGEAWREAIEIARRSGVRLRIAHERLDKESLLLLEDSADIDLAIDSYLYPAGSTSLTFHLPVDVLVGGVMDLARRLEREPELAQRLSDHLDRKFASMGIEETIVASTTSGEGESRTLDSMAQERGWTPGEVAVDLLRRELPCVLVVNVWEDADAQWDATLKRMLMDDRVIVASDGIYVGSNPHPRGFGTFPRVLGSLSRDQGLITLAAALHKMTGMPARAYGLHDRGVIEPGRRADIVIFDPAVVGGPADFENPRRAPTGIESVFVGGRRVKPD